MTIEVLLAAEHEKCCSDLPDASIFVSEPAFGVLLSVAGSRTPTNRITWLARSKGVQISKSALSFLKAAFLPALSTTPSLVKPLRSRPLNN